MAEQDDPAEAALRLAQALDRIARLARAPQPAAAPAAPETDTVQIAVRLDDLITELRVALAETPAP